MAGAICAFLRQVSVAAHRRLRLRIEVGNFESGRRMIEASIGVGIVALASAEHGCRGVNVSSRLIANTRDQAGE